MKSLASVIVGLSIGLSIAACAARGADRDVLKDGQQTKLPGDVRAEIDRLDQAITDQMAKLDEPRPAPQPDACTIGCGAQQMSTMSAIATSPAPPECKPATTPTCTDVCTLKTSICDNAGRICKLAAEVGGQDAYANDKCNKGSASCEAAKKRCCGCT